MKPRIKTKASELFRLSNRPAAMAAAHNAASTDDRSMATWNPVAGSADSDLLDELDTMVPRSRDLVRNNGLASGAIQTLTDNVVGSVLRLSSKPDSKLLGWDSEQAYEWAANTEAKFRAWAETPECDAGQTLTFLGLTIQAMRGAFSNGEGLAIPQWIPRKGSMWNTRMMMIESDRLDTPPEMQGDPKIRKGIVSDKFGSPVGYWIRKSHPGDAYGAYGFAVANDANEFTYIPAFTAWGRRRVIHLHDKERTGQSRGKPIFAAVMREFKMAGHYESTELQAAVANSLIAAFIESDLDQQTVGDLFASGDDKEAGVEGYWRKQHQEYQTTLKGGAIIPLPVGAKLSSFNPGRPNAAFEGFMMSVLRHMSTGLNIPYELLAKDFSKTNYSSARATLLEAWRYFLGRRRWLKDYWLDPIYSLWLEEAVNAGQIIAPDFYKNRYAYEKCKWIHSGRGWVDPVKEAKAAALRMDSNLSTLEAECAEQGLDWEEVLEQRAREKRVIEDLGLSDNAAEKVVKAEAKKKKKKLKKQLNNKSGGSNAS